MRKCDGTCRPWARGQYGPRSTYCMPFSYRCVLLYFRRYRQAKHVRVPSQRPEAFFYAAIYRECGRASDGRTRKLLNKQLYNDASLLFPFRLYGAVAVCSLLQLSPHGYFFRSKIADSLYQRWLKTAIGRVVFSFKRLTVI